MWLWKWVLLCMLLVASSVAKKQKLEIITEVRRVEGTFVDFSTPKLYLEYYYPSICLDSWSEKFISNPCIRVLSGS